MIWDWLLASVIVYALSALLIHIFYKWLGIRERNRHVVIVTANHQKVIEWVIRSVFFLGWLKGSLDQVTVVDQCSEDDTEHIVDRMAYGKYIRWVPLNDQREVNTWLEQHFNKESSEKLEVIDLRKRRRIGGWSLGSTGER